MMWTSSGQHDITASTAHSAVESYNETKNVDMLRIILQLIIIISKTVFIMLSSAWTIATASVYSTCINQDGEEEDCFFGGGEPTKKIN